MPRERRAKDEDRTNDIARVRKLSDKWAGENKASGSLRADWGEVDNRLLYQLIVLVTARRGAVLIGTDKQGAGYTLSVFLGGEKVLNKWYRGEASHVEFLHRDLEEFIGDLMELDLEG